MTKYFLGINGSFHNAAVCLLDENNNEPVLLCSEDRHSGIPHHQGFPWISLNNAINKAGGAGNITSVGYSRDKLAYRDPPINYFSDIVDEQNEEFLRHELEKLFIELESNFPDLSSLPKLCSNLINVLGDSVHPPALKKRINYLLVKFSNELFTEYQIKKLLPNALVESLNHHQCHAATYFASPFEDSAVITWDGRGEFDTTVLWHGQKDSLNRLSTLSHPFSLGVFYEVFCEYLGFSNLSGPGKLMGLAAYGDGRFDDIFERLIICDDTEFSFRFNPDYLIADKTERLKLTKELKSILGKPRLHDEKISERHKAIAYGAQRALEICACELTIIAQKITKTNNLVLSGGLSLNCVMNEKIRKNCNSNIFLLPPCGDDGTSLGAAILLKNKYLIEKDSNVRKSRGYKLKYNSSYGTRNNKREVIDYLDKYKFQYSEINPKDIAELIHEDKIIGYMSECYEFGPRALCNRSILANPTYLENWDRINFEVKYREDFRPFAPVMLFEDAQALWGEETEPTESPYMLLAPTLNNKSKEIIPAVVHVNLSSRLQTISETTNPFITNAIQEFKKLSGIGCFLNTSLNMSGESIIVDYKDLIYFLFNSNMDAAVIEGMLIRKNENLESGNRFLYPSDKIKNYLSKRKNNYKDYLANENLDSVYYNFFEFYKLIFNEDVN